MGRLARARWRAAGLNVLFNFYNDFDDYEEKAGWKLDAQGNLHPQEKYFIETLVNKFKHHKNLIWAIEESCNKLSRAKQQRLKKVAELVAQTDNFHHPIAQMFQILYYDEVHPDKVSPEDYVNDPHVKMMTWGHYSTKAKGLPPVEQYYRELVGHWQEAAGRYVLLNTEVDKHPTAGADQPPVLLDLGDGEPIYGHVLAPARQDQCAAGDVPGRRPNPNLHGEHRFPSDDAPERSEERQHAVRPRQRRRQLHRLQQQRRARHGHPRHAGRDLSAALVRHDGRRHRRAGGCRQPPAIRPGPSRPEIGPEAALYVKRLDGVGSR